MARQAIPKKSRCKRPIYRPSRLHAIVINTPVRKLVFIFCAALLAFQARTSPLALIVLDTVKPAAGKLPDQWELKVNSGQPDVTTAQEGDQWILHLKSVKSSFSLERGVDIDPSQLPYLMWRWKVTQLPKGGDFRRSSTDDQAAQVLVAFDDRHILTYIWDTTEPQGTRQSASSIPFVHIFAIVCRSGAADTNQWLPESHNVAADYKTAFGKPAPHVKGLRLQINSQHTGSAAESYFGQVVFRSAAQ
jgi:hypothetical protein